MKHSQIMKTAIIIICIIVIALIIHFYGANIITFIKKMHGMQ